MKKLVVSIHDVSPLTWKVVDRMLSELDGIRTSLLVVPHHHEKTHLLESPEFCDWLRRQVHQGHEAVIHGYFHRRIRKSSEGILDRLITRFYTAGEGEFYDIGQDAASELVGKARKEFQEIGLEPEGFIAPAWLLGPDAEQALRLQKLRYTTRLRTVVNLQTESSHTSQSMVWSVRAGWRRACSLAWNASLQQRLNENPLLRIGIHPPDLSHRAIWAQIKSSVRTALADRDPITYLDWVRGQS